MMNQLLIRCFNLYQAAVKRFGKISTMIERDDNIPPLGELILELEQLRKIAHSTLETVHSTFKENAYEAIA